MSTQRGEVYDVKPDPSVGKEQQKTRPCVIVSNNVFNASSGLCIVVPITEGKGITPGLLHVLIQAKDGGLQKESIALCGQVKAVDQVRLIQKHGLLSADKMLEIDKGLRAVLNL